MEIHPLRDICPPNGAHLHDPRATAANSPFLPGLGRGFCTSIHSKAALPALSVEKFLLELREAEEELPRCKE